MSYCGRCGGYGIIESEGKPTLTSVASYCSCPVAHERQSREDKYSPDIVNHARRRLLVVHAKIERRQGRAKSEDPMTPVGEVYHGDF